MTVHALVRSTGRRGWTLRCNVCEHTFAAAVDGRSEAVAFARTNGWIVGERTLCPMCAVTDTARRTA
ncbi:hypothetical protein P3H15_45190 [Rhodococcus sp. T2V]|uniref:hypothetical protein n=1 Tax=Rhodococcus sp. T2V TaxID=3034164 RepID=UPI0023E0C34D|nr:hypothetical protein [Rhodococcus sp. T2V]MDF3312169.1 hypothetical protein [Rhodococcus sp. T2V]